MRTFVHEAGEIEKETFRINKVNKEKDTLKKMAKASELNVSDDEKDKYDLEDSRVLLEKRTKNLKKKTIFFKKKWKGEVEKDFKKQKKGVFQQPGDVKSQAEEMNSPS